MTYRVKSNKRSQENKETGKDSNVNAKHITFTLKEGNIHPGITDNKDTL